MLYGFICSNIHGFMLEHETKWLITIIIRGVDTIELSLCDFNLYVFLVSQWNLLINQLFFFIILHPRVENGCIIYDLSL